MWVGIFYESGVCCFVDVVFYVVLVCVKVRVGLLRVFENFYGFVL